MKRLTEGRPKCLVELAGSSLLDLQIAALRGAGISEVAIVAGYRSDQLAGRNLTLFENPRWALTSMVVSLRAAAAWLSATPCLVSYGDIFYPVETVRRLVAAEGEILISYDPDWLALWRARFEDPLSDAETFRLKGSTVIEIGRKARALDEVEGQYMGLLKFTPAGWRTIEKYLVSLDESVIDKLDMTGLLSRLIGSGVPVGAVPTSRGWGEVDSESDLAYYEREIAAGRLMLAVAGG